MVVEDNELNLKLFCDLLRVHGYEADPVRDGREAVERARAFAPDLVVMDIQMPHVSGLELIEQMKADDGLKRTPIMAVTAYAAKGDEERIRDAGAEGYVSKPISVVRFVEAVKGLLAAADERRNEEEGMEGSGTVPDSASGDAAVAKAVKASEQSVEIEKAVAADGDQAAARAVEASEGAAEVVAKVAEDEEAVEPQASEESRHARESGHPASDNEAEEEGKPDSG